jgi:Mn2+/Fe2+ NRAMP family transporter
MAYDGGGPVRAADAGPKRSDYRRAVGPGVVSGAADIDPTTVATLVVVGATTLYGLAWLALFIVPMLAVVQTLATRVGAVGRRDLQEAVVDRYGRSLGVLLLGSLLAVNVVVVAADLRAGASAIGLLTGVGERWLVAPFAAVLLAMLVLGRYDEVQRILKYVMLCLLVYGVAAVLARPDWAAVARGSLAPSLRLDPAYVAGALALVGTTLTTYMYVWQTVEQVEEPVPRGWLRLREFDGILGAVLAGAIMWFILVASGATLGVHHRSVDTAEQAAEALRPLAGPLAQDVFGVGLLASAIIALPVILASGGYAAGAYGDWRRGLSLPVRQAPRFYTVIGAGGPRHRAGVRRHQPDQAVVHRQPDRGGGHPARVDHVGAGSRGPQAHALRAGGCGPAGRGLGGRGADRRGLGGLPRTAGVVLRPRFRDLIRAGCGPVRG